MKRTLQAMGILALALLAGCDAGISIPSTVSISSHTGIVTVTDVSVGYCQPAVGEKSGTSVCDRTITYETDTRELLQLGLRRSGSWPPVWKGLRADIYFRLCDIRNSTFCYEGAEIYSVKRAL